jgi:hypothetical protein
MISILSRKLLAKIGQPQLIDILTSTISGTQLNTLLLDTFRIKTRKTSAPELLKLYQINRFVKPADLPVIELRKAEVGLLQLLKDHSFEPVELSPVSVVGSCSVVGPADQNKILSCLRGTEVLADATNAIALHFCDLKKRKAWIPDSSSAKFRAATIQRHVRTQPISGAGFTPHFKIACVTTAGLDTGDFTFEKEALLEQLQVLYHVYRKFYNADDVSYRLLCRPGYDDPVRLANALQTFIVDRNPHLKIDVVENPDKAIHYYKGVQYKVNIRWKNNTYEIADGGFVDWTQQMLQNKKERFLIGGMGFEFMYRIMNDML